MKKENENPYFDEKIQTAVLRLISEEYFAYLFYLSATLAVDEKEIETVEDLFEEISKDELSDHMKKLVEWCRNYGYDVPRGPADFAKFASKRISGQIGKLKKKQPAAYYLEQAIESEKMAMDSYKKAIEIDSVCQFQDLQSLLWHVYYDEAEHLEKLNSTLLAVQAGCCLSMN